MVVIEVSMFKMNLSKEDLDTPVEMHHINECASLRLELGSYESALAKYRHYVSDDSAISKRAASMLATKIQRALEIRAWSKAMYNESVLVSDNSEQLLNLQPVFLMFPRASLNVALIEAVKFDGGGLIGVETDSGFVFSFSRTIASATADGSNWMGTLGNGDSYIYVYRDGSDLCWQHGNLFLRSPLELTIAYIKACVVVSLQNKIEISSTSVSERSIRIEGYSVSKGAGNGTTVLFMSLPDAKPTKAVIPLLGDYAGINIATSVVTKKVFGGYDLDTSSAYKKFVKMSGVNIGVPIAVDLDYYYDRYNYFFSDSYKFREFSIFSSFSEARKAEAVGTMNNCVIKLKHKL